MSTATRTATVVPFVDTRALDSRAMDWPAPASPPERGPRSLATLLGEAQPTERHRAWLHGLRRGVLWPLASVAGLLALWIAWAPLSGAVVGAGQVQTELGRKVVQHQEGGIVREVRVRQGQAVRRGDALMVVGDVRSDASLDMLHKMRDAERLRAERSRAELTLAATVAWPQANLPADTLDRERQLFESRRSTLDAQVAALQAQMHQATARISALHGQLAAAERATRLGQDELAINEELAASGFIQKTRLIALERTVADLHARGEAARGEMAEARMQLSGLNNSLAQARGAYQQRAGEELKDASARLREIEDRLRPSQDQVARQTVRAPVDGTVMALRVSAPGTAVGPREALLEIVPSQESLVVAMQVDPHDIEHVRQGDAAEVRLSAFNARSTPLLQARVIQVSPDAQLDERTQRPGYAVQVAVSPEELAKHPHLRLQPGMPAEVFITTPPRSLLAYLLEPLGIFARRALREP
jgi:HlyD family type I secretion membrane fusion protein